MEIRDKEISQAQAMLESKDKEIDSLKHESFIKSPYLWLVVGLVVGGYVAKK